jgi:SAM-dependent methyltransferase
MIDSQIESLDKVVESILNGKKVTHGLSRTLRTLKKEIQIYQNHKQNKPKWENIIEKSNLSKIQIGGGKHYLDGYFNIDISPPADLIFDIREGLPISDERVNFIFSEHTLEHLDYPVSAKRFISECFRILKAGGKLIVGVPDGGLAIKSYLKRDKDYFYTALKNWYKNRNCLDHFNTYIDLVNYVFRDQDDDPKYNSHFWAYDYEKLDNLLKECGFSEVKKWKFDPKIANPKRNWGSVYVSAIK